MASPLRIYSGPAQVTVHDSTNGYLALGFLREVKLVAEPAAHELMDGNEHEIHRLWQFEARLAESNQALFDELNGRRGTKQTLYIVGMEAFWTLSNIFLKLGFERSYVAGEPHTVVVTGQTAVETDYLMQENILGTEGKFETDGGGGVATGWSSDYDTVAIVASFLAGEGNAQHVILDEANGTFFQNVKTVPFREQIKATFSASVKENSGTGGATFNMKIITRDINSGVINTYSEEKSLSSGGQARLSMTQVIEEAQQVKELVVAFAHKTGVVSDILIDNAQLEFGDLSVFKDE